MISVEQLVKSYSGNRVLHGIDHQQQRGQAVVLIGPSGCGKSTFLRCLNQLELADSGTITIDGVTVQGAMAPAPPKPSPSPPSPTARPKEKLLNVPPSPGGEGRGEGERLLQPNPSVRQERQHRGDPTVLVPSRFTGRRPLLPFLSKLLGASSEPTPEQREQQRQLRMRAGMVFQSFNLFPHLTVLENVTEAPIVVKGMARPEADALARQLLTKVGLDEKACAYPSQLSGGQQQRVAIARALAMQPRVMLFDEPTSALDPELRDEVLRVMRDLVEEGMTMIVVTHEMQFARDMADRIVFFDNGLVAESGPPQQIFESPVNARTREFVMRVGTGLSPRKKR